MKGLRLDDFSDRELIHLIADLVEQNDGHPIHSLQIAERLGLDGGARNGRRAFSSSVATRLGWMRRYGVVERLAEGWTLAPAGWAVREAKSNNRLVDDVQRTLDAQLLEATHVLALRRRQAGDAYRTLSRREWQREL